MRSRSIPLAALLALTASGGSLGEPAGTPSLGSAPGEAVPQDPQGTTNPGYFGSGHEAQPALVTTAPELDG